MNITVILLTTMLLPFTSLAASSDAPKGVLPEIRMQNGDEDGNQARALSTEVLISKSENEAIASLQKIIKKRKGQPEEPSLYYRLAELYMRRAKSGRFFDLFRDSEKTQEAAHFIAPKIREQTAAAHLREAVQVYDLIEKNWPKYEDLDAVLFNNAFANQQLNLMNVATHHYTHLVESYPKSPLVPDAHLALGEIAYDKQQFALALEHFKAIEQFPDNRVYAYGMYKAAWTEYNLHEADLAINKLLQVVDYFAPGKNSQEKLRGQHNLRAESLRDLALFFEENRKANGAYSFFRGICDDNELRDSLQTLAKLYDTHSRYADLNEVLAQFIEYFPNTESRVNVELLVTNDYEIQKNRPEVLKHLTTLNEICAPDSILRKLLVTATPVAKDAPKEVASLNCDSEVPRVTTEMAKKWWDLWQKNKDHKEVAEWTVQAFSIRLKYENTAKPDTKARYAYAELLYQLERFDEASHQYELVSDQSQDTLLVHDSSYSALVSREKAAQIAKADAETEILRLSNKYLLKNPQGKYLDQVQFKIGFIHYQAKRWPEAEKYLMPLTQTKSEFKMKSEDLLLDAYNTQKDYPKLCAFLDKLLAASKSQERTAHLKGLQQQAIYAQLQVGIEADKDAPAKLVQYADRFKDSDLAQQSLWQALSLLNARGQSLDAADMCRTYAHKYPQDPKIKDCLLSATTAYNVNGLLQNASETLSELMALAQKNKWNDIYEQSLAARVDILMLEGKTTEARKQLWEQAQNKSEKDIESVAGRIMQSFAMDVVPGAAPNAQPSQEQQHYESLFAKAKIEPFASLAQIVPIERMLANEQWKDAFNASQKFVSGNWPTEVKARANFVRAEVFAHELISQSTKTTVERLSTVLGIKTEKMDKAQTSYNLTIKLTADPDLQMKALLSLEKCYDNFVESVGHPTIKNELSKSEQWALDNELQKLVAPMAQKREELKTRIQQTPARAVATVTPATTSAPQASATELPETLHPLHADKVAIFKLQSRDKCETPKLDESSAVETKLEKLAQAANRCISLDKFTESQNIAEQMVRLSPNSADGVFYLSAIAQAKKQTAKAKYLLTLAIKKEPNNAVLAWYQGENR